MNNNWSSPLHLSGKIRYCSDMPCHLSSIAHVSINFQGSKHIYFILFFYTNGSMLMLDCSLCFATLSTILLHLDKKTCITMLPVNGSTLKMLFMLTSVFSRLHSMKSVSIIETAFVQSFSDYMKSFVQVILSKTGTISRSFQND